MCAAAEPSESAQVPWGCLVALQPPRARVGVRLQSILSAALRTGEAEAFFPEWWAHPVTDGDTGAAAKV